MDNLCEKCGHEVKIGEFPFCPHEPTKNTHAFAAHTDYFNFEQDMTFTSAADVDKQLKKDGLQMKGRKRGMPGQWI